MRFRSSSKLAALLLALFVLGVAGRARAVVIAGGNGMQNTTATGSGISYWNNVAYVPAGSGTVVYLGSKNGAYWALTAAHVDGGNEFTHMSFGRNTSADDGAAKTFKTFSYSQQRLSINYNNTTYLSDLMLERIDPSTGDASYLDALPQMQFGAAPAVGSNFTVVGSGRDRASATLTNWRLSGSSDATQAKWTVVANNPIHRSGYYHNVNSFSKRWATNTVEAGSEPDDMYATVGGATKLFRSTFNPNVTNEGQLSPGDSGGGVFVNNRLVGMPLYVATEKNDNVPSWDTNQAPAQGQPAPSSAFFNDSYFATLSAYVDQIAAITGLNPSIAGDANLDGLVSRADYLIVRSNLNTGAAAGWTRGDFNLDGRVSLYDLQLLELNYGQTSTLPVPGDAVEAPPFGSVPEPGTTTLLCITATALLTRRRTKR